MYTHTYTCSYFWRSFGGEYYIYIHMFGTATQKGVSYSLLHLPVFPVFR